MGKLIKYPETDITKEIEKDGLKVKIEVYRADEGGWILEIEDELGTLLFGMIYFQVPKKPWMQV